MIEYRERVSLMGRIFTTDKNNKAELPDTKVRGLFYFATGFKITNFI